jgi:hypothetical protein
MRVISARRGGLTVAATAVLLTTAACATTATTATTARLTAAPGGVQHAQSTAATPGWRVVKTFGPDPANAPSGVLTAVSATDAWSAWSGSGFSAIEHWTGSTWRSVPLPARLDGYVKTAVSISASSPRDVWLFASYQTTEALRWTGSNWLLQPIPSWVLRRSSGPLSVTSAVFGPKNVWAFSLGAGAYAAHYDGRTWTKVSLPEAPVEVSVVAADDIWALGPSIGYVMHWNGRKWTSVRLPLLPPRVGESVSYTNITAVGPRDAWLFRTIRFENAQLPSTAMMRWNGTSWQTAPSPADIVGSLAADGDGGLWADGIDINPGGFWYFYHLTRDQWTQITPPGVDVHSPETLTQIPGTRSLWATGSSFSPKGYFAVILGYGP